MSAYGTPVAFRQALTAKLSDGGLGVRLPVTAYVGTTVWAGFHVDLVGSGLRMTGEPDDVPALARVGIPELDQRGYRAYPLIDHVADKVAATVERHGRARGPSTRFRDLVDLVAIIRGVSLGAQEQMRALASEAKRRDISLPRQFDVPDRGLWEVGYAREVSRSLLAAADTLDEALAVVRPFLNPVLEGTASGEWESATGVWVAAATR
jgi:hypothetical protein